MALWPFGRKDPKSSLSPEVRRIFEKAHRLLDDEAAQNEALPEDFRKILAENPDCDRLPNAFGEFGRAPTNPIPVNGPLGEAIYLSRLETSDGNAIAFHRLGAFDNVDVFEVVSENGSHWDVLYLSLYFARKSMEVPSGYRVMADKVRRTLIRGTTLRVDSFPKGIYSATLECTKRLIGIPIGDAELKALEARNDLIRPRKHVEALSRLQFNSQTTARRDTQREEESARTTKANMGRILHTYAALIKAYPDHFMDVSWLPADKQKMIEVFKLSWLLADDDKGRKIAEDWWHLLTRFQPGVGEMPLVIEISKDNPTVKEWRERKALVEPLLEKGIAEDEIYEREIERFKASNKIRQ
jgi:hypothetical protein